VVQEANVLRQRRVVGANVPINASVAITPRTRSFCTASVMVCPIGASNTNRHAWSSPASFCASSRVISGEVNVGHSRDVTIRHRR
jgi:hypothetical protein